MAGNQAVFDAAMRRAQGYAFENQWDRALKEYQRAIAEFPNDGQARQNYAQALYRLQQYPQALDEYTGLLKAHPSDPFLLNRLAEINVAMGRRADAGTFYQQLAQVYLGQNQTREAINAFQELIKIEPTRRDARERLVELHKTNGDRLAAINELVTLSRMAIEGPPEDLAGAVKYAEAAFALDSNHRDAREWLYKLRRRQAEVAGTAFDEKSLRVTSNAPGSTLDARDLNEMFALAMSYQERGQYAVALKQYEAVLGAGLTTPAVHYNLGLLYQQAGQPETAIAHLREAADDPEYGMSSCYTLGLCYRAVNQIPEATQAFEGALRQVDLASINKAEVNDLIELYEAAAQAHQDVGNMSRAASLYTNLAGFLQQRRWRTGRTAEFKARADALAEQDMSAKLRQIGGAPEPAPAPAARPVAPIPPRPAPPPAPAPEEQSIYMRPGGPAGMLGRNPSGMLRPITDFLKPVAPRPVPPPPAPPPPSAENLARVASSSVSQSPSLPPANESLLAAAAAAPLPKLTPLPTRYDDDGSGHLAPSGVPYATLRSVTSVDSGTPSYTGNPALDEFIEGAISDSDEYMASGQLFAATDACFEVIRLAPDFLPIHLRLAEIYRQRGRMEDAAAKLQSVIDVYLSRGETQLAAQVYPALVTIHPTDVHLRTKLATLLLDLGEVDGAMAQYLSLADMLFNNGQHERALEELRRLRTLAPQNPEVRLHNGTYLLRMDRPAEALAEFGRALQLDAGNVPALVRTYITLVMLDRETQWDALQTVLVEAHDGAKREVIGEEVRSYALTTERPALFYALGLLYELEEPEEPLDEEAGLEFATTRLGAMREAFEQGLNMLHPGDRSALSVVMRWRAAAAALGLHDGVTAVTHYHEVVNLLDDPTLEPSPRPNLEFIKLPAKHQIYAPLADAYSLQGNTAEAIEALQAAKTHLPYNREIYTKLAELYFRKGQLGAALAAMEELVNHYQETFQTEKMLEALGYMARLAPNNIAVRRKLADSYLKRGMIDAGLTELDLLSNLQRKDGMIKDAVSTLQRASDIYWTMGQFQRSFEIYDKIVRMMPGDVDVRLQLINLYIQMGRLADAVREQKALAEICLAQNQTRLAEAALHQLIALAPQDPDGYYSLAELLASEGKFDQAARLYSRLQRLEPHNPKLPEMQAEMQRRANGAGTPPPADGEEQAVSSEQRVSSEQ
jgi:tetratricopeptide (TPR) repeat protein